MTAYFNPYHDQSFFGFFLILTKRIGAFLTGQKEGMELASDEVQMLVLVGVALSSGLVGSFLVLRKMTMLANALSHTILVGIVLVYWFFGASTDIDGHLQLNIQGMLLASLLMGIITTFLTEFLSRVVRLQEDASVGVVFTSLFALGIVLVTLLTRNNHIGTEVVMGNVDALHIDDIIPVYLIALFNLIIFTLFYKEFKLTTFDMGLAKAFGISTVFFNYLLMIQVSATAIGAFRAVGVLLVLSFLTGPSLIARLLSQDLKKMLFLAVLTGSFASIIAVALARHLFSVYDIAISTAGVTVCVIIVFYLLTIIYSRIRKS